MAPLVPRYIPAPNWDINANSTRVVLGRLISDPKDPESGIPHTWVQPIRDSDIQSGQKTDWETNVEQTRSGQIGLWARCLQFVGGIGGELSLSHLKSLFETHRFDTLETTYFDPDDAYLAQALQDQSVQDYFEVHGSGRKPVYMITGLKVARGGARVKTGTTSETTVAPAVEGDLTAAGAPVTVGIGGSYTTMDKRGTSYANSSDYVFAYRLLRLKRKLFSDEYASSSYVKGAAFGKGEGEDDDGDGDAGDAGRSVREMYDLDDYDDEDLTIPDVLEEV